MLRQSACLRATALSRLASPPSAPVFPLLRTLTTSAASASSPSPAAHAVFSQRATATATATATGAAPRAQAPSLPFVVGRTPSDNLAVYQEARSGKTNKFTLVRRVEGDRSALREALVQELGFPASEVKVKPVTGHVAVKGWHGPRITEWLKAKGF